jgi:uncharacterized OB-fold protein
MRPDHDWQAFLAEGRFMIQRSRSSGRHVFPPRVAEPGTGVRDLEWVEACGTGTLYAFTSVPGKPPAPPGNVALVDLDEGPRLMTRLEGVDHERVRPGLRVRARIVEQGGAPLLVFEPA